VAHVERQQIGDAAAGGRLDRTDDARRRPREQCLDRALARLLERHHASVRPGEQRHDGETRGAQPCAQPVNVRADLRLDERVQQGDGGPLVLAALAPDVGGADDEDLVAVLAGDEIANSMLVGGIAVAVDEADDEAFAAGRDGSGTGAPHADFVERVSHRPVREHAL